MHPDDALFPSANASAPTADGWVLCSIGSRRLALPQSDVHAIEVGHALDPALPGESAIGWFAAERGALPVHRLDDELQPQADADADAPFIVFVADEHGARGVQCALVRLLPASAQLRVEALPATLRPEAGPLSGLARLEDEPVLVSSARALLDHLRVPVRP